MGQYHKIANLDKMEIVEPYPLGLGAKQWEHIGEGGLDTALYVLLTASPARGGGDLEEIKGVTGRWVGDRVAVIGDYTEDSDIPNSPIPASEIYGSDKFEDISSEVATAIGKIFGFDYSGDGWRNRVYVSN
jgi:hypothetical protein